MYHKIDEVINDIKNGKIVIIIDDEDRENEGDFVMAADKVTPDAINFMAMHGRGLICTPLTRERAEKLNLPLMVKSNDSLHETAFTVSIDSKKSGTGISAQARALTVEALASQSAFQDDFVRPGHIFPLIAREGGVLEREGHTEATVDLIKLAGLNPVGVICEILNKDGSMARSPDLIDLAKKFDLKIGTIKDLIEYKKNFIEETSSINFKNKYGDFKLHMFVDHKNNEHHVALVKGKVSQTNPTLLRIHSECFTGDIFGSVRCDCGLQLEEAMKSIEENGNGILLYMRQEGRGIGLPNKIKAYVLQDKGYDTVEANLCLGFESDLRDYSVAAEILNQLNVKKVDLMTNNPLKIEGLKNSGILVNSRIPIEVGHSDQNDFYLKTKQNKMGHIFSDSFLQ